MKQKFFSSVLIFIALLVVSTGSALADGTVTGMSVSRGGGLTFTFSVTGYLSSEQLNGGYVQVQGGDSFKLNCAQKDEFTVVCHAPDKINAGVTVGFGGSTFWVDGGDIPQPHNSGSTGGQQSTQSCYSMYGSNTNELVLPSNFTYIGARCDSDQSDFSGTDPHYGPANFHWYTNDEAAVAIAQHCNPSYSSQGDGFYAQNCEQTR